MKISSSPVAPDRFQKIQITIVIETADEATAFRKLCDEDSRLALGLGSKEMIKFFRELRPHVTPAQPPSPQFNRLTD